MADHRPTLGLIVAVFLAATVPPAGDAAAPAPVAVDTSRSAPPEILILGSDHMAQVDSTYPASQVRPVVEALKPYRPDMVVVEHLPPDWPKGKGRDYRPGFDLDEYARRWGIKRDGLRPRIDSAVAAGQVCRAARLFFLRRDLVNAAYRWTAAGCRAERDSAIGEFLSYWSEHEMTRLAFPVARSAGLERIVSFDYQGEDARWFIGPEYFEKLAEEGGAEFRAQVDSLNGAMKRFRAREAEFDETHDLIGILRRRNSEFWVEEQRRLYEEILPRLEFRNAGRRQTENYWRRNREMFENIQEAVQRRGDVDRVLVVVGAGHKYFLDELARDAGWEWVDPLDYLPEPDPGP